MPFECAADWLRLTWLIRSIYKFRFVFDIVSSLEVINKSHMLPFILPTVCFCLCTGGRCSLISILLNFFFFFEVHEYKVVFNTLLYSYKCMYVCVARHPLRFCPAFGFSAVLFGTLLKCLRLCCSLHLTREAIVNQYNLSGATIICSMNVSMFINMQFSGDWRFMLIIIFYYRLRVERHAALHVNPHLEQFLGACYNLDKWYGDSYIKLIRNWELL